MNNESKHIHHNLPQLRMQLVDAQIMAARWGRATGKTSLGGWWTSDRLNRMPRSGNAITGSTYTHLLTKLAPGIIKAWESLGYVEGIHFWFNRYPPKNFKIPSAYSKLLSPKYTIFWWNGAYTQFLSADRGLNNALNADSMYFDEARFLKEDKVREITLTVRGNFHHFGDLSCHNSILYTSDAPRSSASQWFNELEKQMKPEKIETIMMGSIRLNQLKMEYRSASKRKQQKLLVEIKKYERLLNDARRDQLYFSKASTLENVHALGLQAIKNFKKVLSEHDFKISILNMDSLASPNSFYPLLNEELHGYHSENTGYVEALDIDLRQQIERDCLWKSPKYYDKHGELDIALDYNNAINSLVVGQGDEQEYRLLNSLFVLGENREYLADVVKKFVGFYRHHKNKTVNYYYDHTAIPQNASGRITFSEEVCKVLRKNGWQVKEHRIYMASKHEDRFEFWLRLLSEKDSRLPRFRYDIDDAHQWQVSAEGAGVKQTEKGFKKDKSTETRKNKDGVLLVRPEMSTHLSEAADTLMDGRFGKNLMEVGEYVDYEY